MQKGQIDQLKQQLEREKKELVDQIGGLEQTGLSSSLSESIGELSVYDNHPADIGDELFERSKDLALRDNAHILLENIEEALKRIHNGTYGYCEKCGQQIPFARLEVLPSANECIDCQQDDDARDSANRPLEELILTPPFGRTFLDSDAVDSIGFDGEDALQAVMAYGSSDTPQDIPGADDYKDLFLNSHEHQGIVDRADIAIDPSDKRKSSMKE